MLKPDVLQKFASIFGPERCKTSKEDLLTYAYDAYVHEYLPDAVLFPKSAQEGSQIMKTASSHNVFVPPRGAGANGYRVEIVWHRRETRRQTEKTNLNLSYREKPVYSTQFIF
jgi:hypothetical protein